MKKSASTPRQSGSNQTLPRPTTIEALARQTKGDLDGALDDVNEAIRLKPDLAHIILATEVPFAKPKAIWTARSMTINEAIRLKPDYSRGIQQPRWNLA